MPPPDAAPSQDSAVTITTRIADEPQLLAACYSLRYAVAVGEMRKNVAAADHARRWIRDELDIPSSTILCALAGDEVVATLRIVWGAHCVPPVYHNQFLLWHFADFPGRDFSFTSRLAVDRQWRNGRVLGQLLNHGYQLVRDSSCRFDFCQCAPALVQLYERLGYRRFSGGVTDPDLGFRIPMVLLTEDADRLTRLRSPFLSIAQHFSNSDETARWFAVTFPDFEHAGVWTKAGADLVHELSQRLFDTENPLFRGMKETDIEAFIRAATVLECAAGDYLIRQGDIGDDMFLVLSGAANVCRVLDGKEYPIATLGVGQVFGEMGFLSMRPRSASVCAIDNLQVLTLSQQSLRALMRTLPGPAMQILFNLAVILCERLDATTEHWLQQLGNEHPAA